MANRNPIFRAWRVLRWIVLVCLVIGVLLAIKQPVAPPKPDPVFSAGFAHDFETKVEQLAAAREQGDSGAEVRFTSSEVNAELAKSETVIAPEALLPKEAVGQVPKVNDTRVSFEDDKVVGYFQSELYGKAVYVTVAGRLGAENGYVTFEPTGFKIGELTIPVSLVDPVLQRKLAEPENREKLKLPGFVAGLRVESGQLLVVQK